MKIIRLTVFPTNFAHDLDDIFMQQRKKGKRSEWAGCPALQLKAGTAWRQHMSPQASLDGASWGLTLALSLTASRAPTRANQVHKALRAKP